MGNINWQVIGAIAGVIGVATSLIAIRQNHKRKRPTNNINQKIKGILFLKNDISQKIEKKD